MQNFEVWFLSLDEELISGSHFSSFLHILPLKLSAMFFFFLFSRPEVGGEGQRRSGRGYVPWDPAGAGQRQSGRGNAPRAGQHRQDALDADPIPVTVS